VVQKFLAGLNFCKSAWLILHRVATAAQPSLGLTVVVLQVALAASLRFVQTWAASDSADEGDEEEIVLLEPWT
jgi:hypothetical protein